MYNTNKKTKQNKTVNVLGTEYKIVFDMDGTILPKEIVARCDTCTKTIYSTPFEDEHTHRLNYLRHELIHAFFYESGLNEYYQDERLTDWIAMQFPKLARAIQRTELDIFGTNH